MMWKIWIFNAVFTSEGLLYLTDKNTQQSHKTCQTPTQLYEYCTKLKFQAASDVFEEWTGYKKRKNIYMIITRSDSYDFSLGSLSVSLFIDPCGFSVNDMSLWDI